jgi:hypothetical protein
LIVAVVLLEERRDVDIVKGRVPEIGFRSMVKTRTGRPVTGSDWTVAFDLTTTTSSILACGGVSGVLFTSGIVEAVLVRDVIEVIEEVGLIGSVEGSVLAMMVGLVEKPEDDTEVRSDVIGGCMMVVLLVAIINGTKVPATVVVGIVVTVVARLVSVKILAVVAVVMGLVTIDDLVVVCNAVEVPSTGNL